MKQINLSTRDMRAFVALADLRSFTRAADRCNLSRSAFSTLVRSIEDTLGAKLFDRDTRRVELTVEGQLLEGSLRRVLADFDKVIGEFGDHSALQKGRVSIAALPSIAAGWLPRVFAEFRAKYPGVELELADVLSAPCLALVRTGRADFALASTPGAARDLEASLFCEDRFHLVCHRAHPLAKRANIRIADLADSPFVHLARSSSVRRQLEATFDSVPMKTVLEVEQLATLTGMIEAGLGITVVPGLTLFQFRRPGLVTRPLAIRGLVRKIYLVKRRGVSLSAGATGLYNLMLRRRPGAGDGA